jgi:uncharacterized protein (TIGR03435 family)
MKILLIGAILLGPAFGQSFDVVSVKPFQAAEGKQRAFSMTPGGATFRNVSLREVIAAAYGLKEYQIAGPSWLSSDGYEIIAKTGAPASGDQLKSMLQGLLAERFHMKSHRDSKEQPVYALTAVKKTSALHKAAGEGDARLSPAKGGGLAFQNYTVARLAEYLGHLRAVNRPVLDMTGIEGTYDFTILIGDPTDNPAEAKRAVETAFKDDSILEIVASQLGLKIESRKTAVEMLVIDGIERPSIN